MDLVTKDQFMGNFHKHDISLAKDDRERKAIEIYNSLLRRNVQ